MLINNENLRWVFMGFESRNVKNSPHDFREKNNVYTCQKRHHNISTYIKMCVYDIENIRNSCFFKIPNGCQLLHPWENVD